MALSYEITITHQAGVAARDLSNGTRMHFKPLTLVLPKCESYIKRREKETIPIDRCNLDLDKTPPAPFGEARVGIL